MISRSELHRPPWNGLLFKLRPSPVRPVEDFIGQIRVPHAWSFEGDNKPVLVHEVTHVWQYPTRGTSYITDSVYHNASGQIATGNRNVAYMNYQLQPDSNLTDFYGRRAGDHSSGLLRDDTVHQNDTSPPAWIAVRRPDLAIYER
jgi:hypothetical protein